MIESNAIESLKISVKNTFSKPLNSIKSFEELSYETKVSSQTLSRFFGKIDKDKTISKTSLSLLCKYIGFKDLEDFTEQTHNQKLISDSDKLYIENMAVFFRNGEKIQHQLSPKHLNCRHFK